MTSELAVRLIGMLIGAVLGSRLGLQIAVPPLTAEVFTLVFGLLRALAGLILTPFITTRPARRARDAIRQMPAEVLVTSIIGLIFGLIIAALFSVPSSLLPQPFGQWVPTIIAIVAAYLSITIFGFRAKDVFRLANQLLRGTTDVEGSSLPPVREKIVLDTSVIIDGRVLDISRTGFLIGTLVVPRFVLAELQHIADSGDTLRRNRGKRGLDILEELRHEEKVRMTIVDDDFEGVREVDDKLVL